jgi:hypothetical protein
MYKNGSNWDSPCSVISQCCDNVLQIDWHLHYLNIPVNMRECSGLTDFGPYYYVTTTATVCSNTVLCPYAFCIISALLLFIISHLKLTWTWSKQQINNFPTISLLIWTTFVFILINQHQQFPWNTAWWTVEYCENLSRTILLISTYMCTDVPCPYVITSDGDSLNHSERKISAWVFMHASMPLAYFVHWWVTLYSMAWTSPETPMSFNNPHEQYKVIIYFSILLHWGTILNCKVFCL